MNQNGSFRIKWYVIVFLLVLGFAAYSLMYPVKYGLSYFLSYSNEKVDSKLTAEFANKLLDAGIVEIKNGSSLVKSQSKVTFYMDYTKYSKEDTYHKSKLKNAWITFDGKKIKFVGELKLNYLTPYTKYDQYDAGYLAGKEAIQAALAHIGDIKHHVTRDLIKVSKQKNAWDNLPNT